ncbi:MAG: ATP-binding protein, partial [Bacteroidota bacterium]
VKEEQIILSEWFKKLVAQFSSYGDSESIRLIYEDGPEPDLMVRLDIDKVEKIIRNYLSNAIKYSPKGAEVVLSVKVQQSQLLISVKDNGPGISPADLPHIFDRFYQSGKVDHLAENSTGIGLALCKELATLLKGEVWVESQLGKGSTFFLALPFLHKITKSDTPAKASTINKLVSELYINGTSNLPKVNGRILIVEDNQQLRSYLSSLLANDYQLVLAQHGAEAWDILNDPINASNIDLILSDLMMPVMDGFTFLEKVKNSDKFRHLPFVLLTARSDIRVKLSALRIGIDDYLTKPFEPAELLLRIHNLLYHYQVRTKQMVTTDVSPDLENAYTLSESEASWLAELEQFFIQKITDSQFKLDWIAQQMYLSERQLRRRMKQLTGMSPNAYLREIRLQTARAYLEDRKFNSVKEVSYAVGFSSPKYFTTLFIERFGSPPSKLL